MTVALTQADRSPLRQILAKGGIFLFLAALLILGGIAQPVFLSAGNVSNMLVQLAPLVIVVLGQTFVIISRGLDLSVASIMATAAITPTLFPAGGNANAAIIAATLAVGLAAGVLNGVLVTKRNVSPFLATLATAILLQGLRFAATAGAPSGNIPDLFKSLGTARLIGLPLSVWIAAGLALLCAVLLHKSTYGRQLYIVGGNPVAGELVGIRPDRVIILAYILSGLLSALAGLMLAGFAGVVDNNIGRGFELDSIVAAVIGGVALSGGRGGIAGAVAGAAILVSIFTLVLLIGVPVQAQMIIKGVVILAAAAFYVRRTRF